MDNQGEDNGDLDKRGRKEEENDEKQGEEKDGVCPINDLYIWNDVNADQVRF